MSEEKIYQLKRRKIREHIEQCEDVTCHLKKVYVNIASYILEAKE